MDNEKFIYCLEVIPDIETDVPTEVVTNLEQLAFEHHIGSIYKACDTIEGLEDSLNALLYRDHNFRNYEIIYLVLQGEGNNVCINDYYYSLEEIAELFEGKMTGKILHFANEKVLDLTPDEAQYFLDVTGAKAVSGYGVPFDKSAGSAKLDKAFFTLFEDDDDVVTIVEELYKKHYTLCTLLDFRLYY